MYGERRDAMRSTFSSLMVLCLGLVLITGCFRTAAIQNITDASMGMPSGTEPSLDQVTKAILAAATGPHPAWNMKVEKPGHILATLFVRRHRAAVDITYTTNSYSITYNSSDKLDYDAGKGTIHSNDNGWVQNLNNAILNRLAQL